MHRHRRSASHGLIVMLHNKGMRSCGVVAGNSGATIAMPPSVSRKAV